MFLQSVRPTCLLVPFEFERRMNKRVIEQKKSNLFQKKSYPIMPG